MKREVFLCSAPRTEERVSIARSIHEWWKAQPVKLIILTPRSVGCDGFEFQSIRRKIAESISNADYIVADDDCLPMSDFEFGFEALASHQDFGIISAWPANASIARWTPEDYIPFEDSKVREVNDVGGIRVCRKGAMSKGWPPQTRKGYDPEHCQALRMAGYRVGYSLEFKMQHLGEGNSDLWAQLHT